MSEDLEVRLDADFIERTRVGTLSHDRGHCLGGYLEGYVPSSAIHGLPAASR